jgi:hypothetical protein
MAANTTLLLEVLIPLMIAVIFGAMRALILSQNSRFDDFAKQIKTFDERILDLSRRFDVLTGRFERHLDSHK